MICHKPIDAAVLADYWLALLPETEEEAVEEHLLSCDSCGDHLRETIALAEAVRQLARDASLFMVVSDAFLQRVDEQGYRIREYAPPRGGSVACTVTAEDDFLIGHLAADLRDAKRVDLCFCDAQGVEQQRLADVPFRAASGRVDFQTSITYAKSAPSDTMIARLVAVDESNSERVLGEYTFDHYRSLPGPGAW